MWQQSIIDAPIPNLTPKKDIKIQKSSTSHILNKDFFYILLFILELTHHLGLIYLKLLDYHLIRMDEVINCVKVFKLSHDIENNHYVLHDGVVFSRSINVVTLLIG